MADHVERMAERIQREWFPDHVAELRVDESNIQVLRWAKPGTRVYTMEFILRVAVLFIWGDLGEAVHAWSRPVTWEFLAGCDYSYWAEKRRASPTGRRFDEFRPEVLREDLADYILEDEDGNETGNMLEVARAGFANMEEEHEWLTWARDNWEREAGQDSWESFVDGRAPTWLAVAHWVGLRMAVTSLRAHEAAALARSWRSPG